MKRNLLFLFFAMCTPLLLSAQDTIERQFRVSAEYGYFNSSFYLADNNGSYLQAGFGYKINNDFWLSLDIIKINSTGNFETHPLFLNTPSDYSNTMIIPNFTKDWDLNKNWVFSGTLGGALIFERAYPPYVNFTDEGFFEGVSFSNQGEAFNIGLYGSIALKYKITDNLHLGINVKSYLPMYLDPDSFMIGPSVEMKL